MLLQGDPPGTTPFTGQARENDDACQDGGRGDPTYC